MQLTESVYDSHFYGTGFISVEFNPKADMGLGAIELKSADPFYSFPDPSARSLKLDCNNFTYAEPVDIDVLKKRYPEVAKFLKPDLLDMAGGSKTDLTSVIYRSINDTGMLMEGSNPYELSAKNQAIEQTVYIKDDTFDEIEKEETNPETGEVVLKYEQKLKYPNGRKICKIGNVLAYDGPKPYDDDLFPYARLINYTLPREFWGISEVEQLESPQKIFNKLVSFTLDVLTLTGNPVWLIPTNSGVDTDNIFNRPGLNIEYDGNDRPERVPGVELQSYVLPLIDRMREWFDGVGGQSDVSQGIKPEGVTAASAITALQEAAQTRLRLKSRNLDGLLQDAGQLYLSRVMQFYTTPRIIRLTSNQNAQKYFKFHVEEREQNDGSSQKFAVVQKHTVTQDGQDVWHDPVEYPVKGNFDVRVTTGSSLPFAKAEKFNKAKEMFQLGVIDEEELLKQAEYPNWEAVLERVKAKREEKALMQQQAAMQGAPPAA